ncbi:MAG: NAD(P)-dependent oxidoreductase [Polyangiales bacterium]
MRILVTGADGFIGSHVASALARAGHSVVRTVYGRAPEPGELRVDLSRPSELLQLPNDVDVVVHAAGAVDAHAPYARMVAANVTTTHLLAGWAALRNVGHFVHFSSVAVYGPLALGVDRDESTPRLGLGLGLPYMRTKALAERAVERAGVPFTLVRPPVVLGSGDTVISRGFRDALCHDGGIPLVPGASLERRVSLALVEGLGALVVRLVARGPLGGPVHAVDADLTVGELAARYAEALERPLRTRPISWTAALRTRNEVGTSWLIASTRFGQHYRAGRLLTEVGYTANFGLESAIESGLSSLQGSSDRLF